MESVAGVFPDPALLAFRDVGPRQPLYRVVFKQRDVWANCGLTYAGSPGDTVVVEVRGVSSHCTQASTAPPAPSADMCLPVYFCKDSLRLRCA